MELGYVSKINGVFTSLVDIGVCDCTASKEKYNENKKGEENVMYCK